MPEGPLPTTPRWVDDSSDARPATDAHPDEPAPPRWGRARRMVSWVCIVLFSLTIPLGVLAVWLDRTVTDEDRYVDTLAPLARDRVITDQVALRITNAVLEQIDVDSEIRDALPDRAAFLAEPLSEQLGELSLEVVGRLLRSAAFQELWDAAIRASHRLATAIIDDRGPLAPDDEGRIVIDLSPIIDEATSRLDDAGITILDDVDVDPDRARFVLFEAEEVTTARTVFDALEGIAWFLPVVALVFGAAAVAVATDRRRALVRCVMGAGVATLAFAVGLQLGRAVYLDQLSGANVDEQAAGNVFDTLTRFLRGGFRWVLAIALSLVLGAWLAGPSGSATRLRGSVRGAIGAAGSRGSGRLPKPVVSACGWVRGHRGALRMAGVVVAGAVVVLAAHPAASTVLWVAALLVVYLAAIELMIAAAGRVTAAG